VAQRVGENGLLQAQLLGWRTSLRGCCIPWGFQGYRV
jgi:hypothetical protein